MKLDRDLSAYLDFLRFMAALAVVLGHMDQDGLYMSWFPLAKFSHEAVIVFFVMSGFIIYSTSIGSNRSASEYIVARLSRVYSVAFPAVLLCTSFELVVQLFPSMVELDIPGYRPFSWWDMGSSLLFLNESWLNPAALSLNGPYWSLCYEVWYYVIFGMFVYLKGMARIFLICIAALIAGPAILVLFPIWLLGAWLAKKKVYTESMTAFQANIIFFGSFCFIFLVNYSGVDWVIKDALHDGLVGFWRLEYSQRVITDYLIGVAVFFNILVFDRISISIRNWVFSMKEVFSYLAGFSFTLYLFHRPMCLLVGYYFPNVERSIVYSVIVLFVIVFCCFLISFRTERQLKYWRHFFSRFTNLKYS